MKASKVAVAGVLAAMFAVLPAAGASAKSLALEVEGTPVATGSPGAVGIGLEECGMFSTGTVSANVGSKGILKLTAASAEECSSPSSKISGLFNEVQFTKAGKVSLKGAVTVATSAECAYEFKNPKGTYEIPGFTFFEGNAKGKLTKASNKEKCTKTVIAPFFGDASNEVFGEPFEDVILS